MNLVALSRANVEGNLSFGQEGPCVAICIAFPKGRLHAVAARGLLLDVLHLRFSDCDGEGRWRFPDRKDPDVKALPMSPAQAAEVVDFAEFWKERVDTIYCACFGGVSRSVGVLHGLAKAYGWDPPGHGDPNPWCMELVALEAARRRVP